MSAAAWNPAGRNLPVKIEAYYAAVMLCCPRRQCHTIDARPGAALPPQRGSSCFAPIVHHLARSGGLTARAGRKADGSESLKQDRQ
jgi:hypothetical protein